MTTHRASWGLALVLLACSEASEPGGGECDGCGGGAGTAGSAGASAGRDAGGAGGRDAGDAASDGPIDPVDAGSAPDAGCPAEPWKLVGQHCSRQEDGKHCDEPCEDKCVVCTIIFCTNGVWRHAHVHPDPLECADGGGSR